jgi:hypothetical protein
MAAELDLKTIEALCQAGADAALDMLIGLGPRPLDPAAATAWDAQGALLKGRVSMLTNMASSIGSTIVVQALQNVWPKLEALGQVTTSAKASIAKISEINKTLSAIASIVNFGTATITLVAQPTPANASGLIAAFKNTKAAVG